MTYATTSWMRFGLPPQWDIGVRAAVFISALICFYTFLSSVYPRFVSISNKEKPDCIKIVFIKLFSRAKFHFYLGLLALFYVTINEQNIYED